MAKMNKKFVATTLTAAMVATAIAPVAGAAFTDQSSVPSWAEAAVKYVSDNKIMEGKPGGVFAPEENLTRGEVAAILTRAFKLSYEGKVATFEDSKGHWASEYIAAVVEAGYAEGKGNGFDPDGNITREELSKMVTNAYKLTKNEAAIISFTDNNTVWAKQYVETLASLGIVEGTSVTTFNPTGLVSRAQAATFIHRAADSTVRKPVNTANLQVTSVQVLNSREILVTYNQEVDLSSASNNHSALNLNNYYVGLTSNVTTTSIAALDTASSSAVEWEAVAGSDYDSKTGKGKTVIIRSIVSTENLFDVNSDLKIKKDEEFNFEVRNVESAAGKGMNTQQFKVKATDETRPTIKLGVTKVQPTAAAGTLEFKASEALLAATLSTAKIYLDGLDVTSNFAIKNTSGTVAEASTLVYTVPTGKALVEGKKYTFAFVGLQDTAENLLSPNPTEISFTVESASTQTVPVVLDVVQTADNAVRIIVDKAIDMDSNAGNLPQGKITVKKIDGTNDKTFDLSSALTGATFVADTTYTAPTANPSYKAYTLTFTTATNSYTANDLSYNGATQLIREFVIEDLYTDNATAATHNDKKSTKYTKTIVMQKDIYAPVLAEKDAIKTSTNNDGFVISINEKPFGKAIEAGLTSGKNVIVKLTKDGITYTDEIEYASGTTVSAGKYVVDGTKNQILVGLTAGTGLVDTNGKLLPGVNYSITLKDNIVNDGAASGSDKLDPARAHKFVGTTVNFNTAGSNTSYAVPQTSQNDVQSVGNNVFEFQIHGKDIDSNTVRNLANYTLDGQSLPTGTTVDFVQRGTTSAPTYFAVLTLPTNSIKYDGNYRLTVRDIATKAGYKMLPTNLIIAGKDNTAPVLNVAKMTSSNTIELTFSENITAITAPTAAVNNFKVVIGGVAYTVSSVNDVTPSDNVIEIVTSSNFDINASGTVQVVLDVNGNIEIKDNSTLVNKAGNGSAVSVTK